MCIHEPDDILVRLRNHWHRPCSRPGYPVCRVRTDLELNLVGEPVSLYCRPGDDVIPVPEAIAVTGIHMSELEASGLTETEFSERVVGELGQPGTCGCGFNSIRFDDEFTRHLLYRNFLDPYAREWQGGNSRWDVIDAFRMAQALRPEGINWPTNDAGEPVFRLEALAAANGVEHTDAHEALSDVMATIGMTRRLKSAQPKLFRYLFELRQKRAVIEQLYPLGKFPVVHVSSMYGAGRQFTSVVLPLCSHPVNSNGVICYDLTRDPAELLSLDPETLHRRLFTPDSELAEDEARIHLKTIHVNRSPAVAPMATLSEDDATRLGISLEDCRRHQQQLMVASGLTEKVQDAFAITTFPEPDDPDLMLYSGDFFSDRDREAMLELRSLEPDALAKVGDTFDDPRIAEMIFRFRAGIILPRSASPNRPVGRNTGQRCPKMVSAFGDPAPNRRDARGRRSR
ncbi:MAG: exodeoxyribonuclease I [Gammaproteobacteria bacterium]|nr:exodeoxyribonuclease I [Gammaproteobacteria bacterium]